MNVQLFMRQKILMDDKAGVLLPLFFGFYYIGSYIFFIGFCFRCL